MKENFPLVGLLATVLILSVGCLGGGTIETTEISTPLPTQASVPTATIAVTPAIQATSTQAAVAETPTAEATASTASSPQATASTVEEVPEILSYRLRVLVSNNGPRGTDMVQLNGAYIKEPPTELIEFDFQQGEQSQRMATMLVDGTRYMNIGDRWMQSPDAIMNIAELTLLTPQNVAGLLGQMELVGLESVNALSAYHYQGSKEIIPVVGTEGDTLDVSRIESAQLDLWVDETYNAIVRLTLEASNSEPPITATLTYDYIDLNTEIQIAAPEIVQESSATPAGDFVPKNELGELLGFNLMFPTGSTVETVVGATLYVIVGPYTLEEAPTFIETTMQSNGYTQLSQNIGSAGEIIYLFQREQKAVNITLTAAGDGNTRFQFAIGP